MNEIRSWRRKDHEHEELQKKLEAFKAQGGEIKRVEKFEQGEKTGFNRQYPTPNIRPKGGR